MISRASFEFVRDVVAREAGIQITKGTEYLLESRLLPIARERRASSVNEFIRSMQSGELAEAEQILVEALVDTETCFFRDVRPFDALRRTVLPELKAKRAEEQRLSIWSLGCSTGQEPYSIALLLQENFADLLTWRLEIVGSDISQRALQLAQAGRYNQLEVNRGLPVGLLIKWFQKVGLEWHLKAEVCRMVQFNRMNVLQDWPAGEPHDIIVCRNVLSSFGPEEQQALLRQMQMYLRPDGYLFLGAKETPPGLEDCFEAVQFDKTAGYRPRKLSAPSEGQAGPTALPGAGRVGGLSVRAGAPNLSRLCEALSAPLAKAMEDSFVAMLSEGLQSISPTSVEGDWKGQVAGVARFSGAADGTVALRFRPEFARNLAGQILGLSVEDTGEELVPETIGHLIRLVADNLKTEAEKAGIIWKIEKVEVTRSYRSDASPAPKATRELLAFQFQNQPILVDLLLTAPGQK